MELDQSEVEQRLQTFFAMREVTRNEVTRNNRPLPRQLLLSRRVAHRLIENLPKVEIGSLGQEDRSCSICYEVYGESVGGHSEHPVKLPCGHVFGFSCISIWLKENCTCPSCRRRLESESTSAEFPVHRTQGAVPRYRAASNHNLPLFNQLYHHGAFVTRNDPTSQHSESGPNMPSLPGTDDMPRRIFPYSMRTRYVNLSDPNGSAGEFEDGTPVMYNQQLPIPSNGPFHQARPRPRRTSSSASGQTSSLTGNPLPPVQRYRQHGNRQHFRRSSQVGSSGSTTPQRQQANDSGIVALLPDSSTTMTIDAREQPEYYSRSEFRMSYSVTSELPAHQPSQQELSGSSPLDQLTHARLHAQQSNPQNASMAIDAFGQPGMPSQEPPPYTRNPMVSAPYIPQGLPAFQPSSPSHPLGLYGPHLAQQRAGEAQARASLASRLNSLRRYHAQQAEQAQQPSWVGPQFHTQSPNNGPDPITPYTTNSEELSPHLNYYMPPAIVHAQRTLAELDGANTGGTHTQPASGPFRPTFAQPSLGGDDIDPLQTLSSTEQSAPGSTVHVPRRTSFPPNLLPPTFRLSRTPSTSRMPSARAVNLSRPPQPVRPRSAMYQAPELFDLPQDNGHSHPTARDPALSDPELDLNMNYPSYHQQYLNTAREAEFRRRSGHPTIAPWSTWESLPTANRTGPQAEGNVRSITPAPQMSARARRGRADRVRQRAGRATSALQECEHAAPPGTSTRAESRLSQVQNSGDMDVVMSGDDDQHEDGNEVETEVDDQESEPALLSPIRAPFSDRF